MIRKILWGIPSFLVSAIYIALGVFIGFNAKTSLMFGILFIACGVLGVGLLFYSPTTPNLRKVLLWTIGLGYGVLAFLASLDNGTITPLEWFSMFLGIAAGGISALCIRKILPSVA
jgi:hypothetical protein